MTSSSADESQNHPDKTQTQNIQQIVTTTVSNNNAKFPYLKKDEYETWAMKMEYWIMNSDHHLWNVVLNGNSKKNVGRDLKGNIIILPPVSAEEQIAIQRETKARTLLLQSLPEDHMAEFHHLDDARDIWLAVKARFRGSLKMKVAITLKAKGGLDYLNFDDLYNKLKSLEIDIKGGSSYKSNHSAAPSHSAFVSTTSGNNKMSYAETLKQSSSYISASPGSNVLHFKSGNVIEDVLHSFVAESDQQIIYEDFNQIGKLDLEELDIKWQMAMLSVRVNRFVKEAGRKMNFNNRDAARFDKKKVKCYKCSQLGHFARECTGKKVESNARYSAFKIKELEQDKPGDPKALLSVDSMVNWSDHEESADENASQVYGMIAGRDDKDEVAGEFALMGVTSQAYKNTLKTLEQQKAWYQSNQLAYEEKVKTKLDNTLARLAKWKESSKNLAKLVDSSMTVKTKLGLGFVKEGAMNDLPPPITRTFMPTSIYSDFDESQITYGKNSNDQSETDSNDFVSCASSDKSLEPKINDFASCDSSDKSSSRKSVESSIFSPRVAESESNLKIAAQEDISFNNNTFYVSSVKDDKHSSTWRLACEFLAGSVNMPAPIPACRQTRPAPIYAGTPVPAETLSQFLLVGETMLLDQCPDLQALIFRIIVGLFIMTKCIWVREDGELLLSPQQVVLGETVDHICKGIEFSEERGYLMYLDLEICPSVMIVIKERQKRNVVQATKPFETVKSMIEADLSLSPECYKLAYNLPPNGDVLVKTDRNWHFVV
ncbi:ribonuclease H-like domain-containing protein [Tanacetum coccineum]